MENDWLSEFQKYLFRTLAIAFALAAIPISLVLGWTLLNICSNIARNPEIEEYQKCYVNVINENNEITKKIIANSVQSAEIMKQRVDLQDLDHVCGERPKEWRWQ